MTWQIKGSIHDIIYQSRLDTYASCKPTCIMNVVDVGLIAT